MIKKDILLLFLLFFTIHCYSQSIFGSIINAETHEKIPYVNIGFQNRTIGTVSNEKGEFQLDYLASQISDTIIFSSIGYNTLVFSVEAVKMLLSTDKVVLMIPKTEILREIIVSSKEFSRIKKLGNGRGSKRKKVGFGPNDNLGREIGTVIKTQITDSSIDNVSINIGINKYGKVKFRVNIYKWKNGKIGDRLNKVPIYVETELQNGIWKVDLKNYNMDISGDFFVSYEYIENMGEYGLYFTFSLNKNPTFMRESNNSEWTEIKYNSKKVSISINCEVSY